MTIGGRFYKLTIDDVPLRGKTILLRADYNVPLTKDGHVADDYRIRSSLPTVKKYLASVYVKLGIKNQKQLLELMKLH